MVVHALAHRWIQCDACRRQAWAQAEPRRISSRAAAVPRRTGDGVGPEVVRETTVVFDASVHPGDFVLDASYRGLGILFAVGDENADARIEQLIAADSHPATLTVVSSDRRIRQAGSGAGAGR